MRILNQVYLIPKPFYIYYSHSFLDILKVKYLGETVLVYTKTWTLQKTNFRLSIACTSYSKTKENINKVIRFL